ncbi:uncharacterized protein LOC123886473 [Trifolium pratense]|uniref:uncharacterized protein LOC123886473 n=1 Tax=Trifolium pratense TaxID=57577 RepID=UPI001E690B1D|nr:uncharacterized protein LOC123886473 [Trifolium pratense]
MAEQRTKKKHEDVANKAAEASSKMPIIIEEDSSSSQTQSDSETESDEETLNTRMRQKRVPDPKGKSPKYVFNEAEIGIGFTKPLRTILPEPTIIPTSDNPLSELEKHLSPDPLNNQPLTHETHKSSSPPKPKSPLPQPQSQQLSPDIPSSKPQLDIPTAEQISPHKSPEPTPEQIAPEPSPEHISPESTSDISSSKSTPEPNPKPSIHTCAPKPSDADVVIIDNPANEPKLSTIPNISPSSSDPFGNLSNQLYDDLLRLSHIKDKFLVCPSDVDMEVSLIKARICEALDAVGDELKTVIGQRDLDLVYLLKDSLARASLKRLTGFNHEEHERAKLAAIAATARPMSAFKECWIDSKLFQSLEAHRVEKERLEEAAARVAQLANELHQEDAPEEDVLDVLNQDDVLMIDYPESKAKQSSGFVRELGRHGEMRDEEYGWQEVRRRRNDRRSNHAILPDVAMAFKSRREDNAKYKTYFFSNFPENHGAQAMLNIFRKYGKVVKVVIPAKRDKGGRRFGFARFDQVRDVRKC